MKEIYFSSNYNFGFVKGDHGGGQPPTLVDIVCSSKSRCAVEYVAIIKSKNLGISAKIWQRSYYDHIIRDKQTLDKLREYIRNNPATWKEDENYFSYNNEKER